MQHAWRAVWRPAKKQRCWKKRGRNTCLLSKHGTFVSQWIGITIAGSPYFKIWTFLCWKCYPPLFPWSESCKRQYISTEVCWVPRNQAISFPKISDHPATISSASTEGEMAFCNFDLLAIVGKEASKKWKPNITITVYLIKKYRRQVRHHKMPIFSLYLQDHTVTSARPVINFKKPFAIEGTNKWVFNIPKAKPAAMLHQCAPNMATLHYRKGWRVTNSLKGCSQKSSRVGQCVSKKLF